MLQVTGIDFGASGTRKVTLGLLGGAPQVGEALGGPKVVAVASDVLTYRRVPLPKASKAVCRRVIQEELAYSLPFPLHQVCWDYVGQSGQAALVMVTPNERLGNYQRMAGSATLDAEPLAYLRAARYCGVHNALLIDFGASKTTFCCIVAGQLEWVRVLLRGGRQLTQALATDNQMALEPAEELKRKRGCEVSTVQTFVGELLEEAMLDRHGSFEQIFLIGGGSALPGLKSFLSLRLGKEPQTFPLPPSLSATAHVTAFGAALALRWGQPRLHLAANQAEDSSNGGGLGGWLAASALWLGALGALGVAGELEHRRLLREHKELRQDLIRTVQPVLPKADSIASGNITSALKENVDLRKSVRQESPHFMNESLGRIAGALREMPQVEIRSIVYNQNRIQLEGEVNSPQEAEKLRERLGKIFTELQQTKLRPGESNHFIYKFEGKMPNL